MSLSHTDADQLRLSGQEKGSIILVEASRREEAVQRLVAGDHLDPPEHARRFLQVVQASQIRLDAMWSIQDSRGVIRWTVLAVPSPGRTAMVFASRATAPATVAPLGRLLDHACRSIAGMGVDLAQALIEPGDALQREALEAAGFWKLADLSYLERPLHTRQDPPAPAWPEDVTVEPYREARRAEVIQILAASYEETLDCPALMGLRRTEDILEGHRATGQFEPGLWTVLRIAGAGAGVLLLNPTAAGDQIELVYLGLTPAARGRGLGGQLLRHGLSLLRARRERSITLAVDDRNAPALRVYEREGFRRVLRRVAMIRSLAR